MVKLCIFCLKESESSDEHIFPAAIGGCVITDWVCRDCNSYLGSKIDVALTDNFAVKGVRNRLNLSGNSGKVPNLSKDILGGVGLLANTKDHRIIADFNEHTGKFNTRILPIVEDVILANGVQAKSISADEKDLKKIIKRERKRAGRPPYSEIEIDQMIQSATRSTLVNPEVVFSLKIDVSEDGVKKALLKIAYELAFHWLGEEYISDLMAFHIRNAILNETVDIHDKITMRLSTVEECPAMYYWLPNKNYHIAYASCHKAGIAIVIKIFDVMAAIIQVSHDSARYLSNGQESEKLRFLVIDPTTKQANERSLMEEMTRIARLNAGRSNS